MDRFDVSVVGRMEAAVGSYREVLELLLKESSDCCRKGRRSSLHRGGSEGCFFGVLRLVRVQPKPDQAGRQAFRESEIRWKKRRQCRGWTESARRGI